MREGVDYKFNIKMRKLTLLVRPLSNKEFCDILSEVKEIMDKAPANLNTRVHEEVELAKRILIKATTSDIDMKDEKLTHFILDRMTTGEIIALYKEYKAWEEEINPDAETINPDKVKQIVADLKKNLIQWRELSRLECKHVVQYLMTQLDSQEGNAPIG